MIRLANTNDLNDIMLVINDGIAYLKKQGIDQWQNGYPNKDAILNDINKKQYYVYLLDDKIVSGFAMIDGIEDTYNEIEGKWLSNGNYVCIHRIAIKSEYRRNHIASSIYNYAYEYCIKNNITSIRIDTHNGNIPMKSCLIKNGFIYTGIIYLHDGNPRNAYELLIRKSNNMKKIENQVYPYERALYGLNDIELNNCKFDGEEDGESALKETNNVIVKSTFFNLRYPLWHVKKAFLDNIEMTEKCRAALWYDKDITINNSQLHGIKAVRECDEVNINNSDVASLEFGWKSKNINVKDSKLSGEYMFLDSKNVNLDNVEFVGKYSFQYVDGAVIRNSKLDTKDAFWHSKNIYVYDSYIKGEYLAWYSEGLHLINCTIEGTQPLCYAKGLVLENCKMINCDLSFEYSDVMATITGDVDSIKNPTSGKIEVDGVKEIILEDSKYPLNCKIKVRK